jgi:hypothetical protein
MGKGESGSLPELQSTERHLFMLPLGSSLDRDIHCILETEEIPEIILKTKA